MARRQYKKLTADEVKRAKRRGYYSDGDGLYLQVTDNGTKSWVYRYWAWGTNRKGEHAYRLREMGLGPERKLTLAEAREKASEADKLKREGTDPIEARNAKRTQAKVEEAKAMPFRQCAEAYIAAHRAGWKNPKHAAQWPATLAAYVYPVFGELPVTAVDVGLVMKALEPIWNAKPETASRVRGRIEAVLDWATTRGYRSGENPARWRGHLENLLPNKTKVRRVEHHAALPYAELPGFIAALRQQEGVAARALEFLILTAARTGEVVGAQPDELDLVQRLWTVPAERMKAGKEHRVPLCDRTIEILEEMQKIRHGDFVFPGGNARRPLSNMAMAMLLRRMGRGNLTVHGFLSTFSDWCLEQTNTLSEVREMALAHAVGDKVEAAYRRSDLFEKRRALAESWAKYCEGISEGTVIPLRETR